MSGSFFPAEVTGHVPRITWTVGDSLYVEQHRGLAAYQPEEILLRISAGRLKITGAELCFRQYTAQEAVIGGRIDAVALEESGGGKG